MEANRVRVIQNHISDNYNLKLVAAASNLSGLRYTLDGHGMLTREQREFYEVNGFVVIKNLISKNKLDAYRKRFSDICSGNVKVPGITIMKDVSIAKTDTSMDETKVTKLQSFTNDPVLFQYCCDPEILKYAKSFAGNDVMAMHTMLINKPPDSGTKSSRHPLHQDLYYFPFRPADRIVASWTAMERVDRSNGCLVVIPGSHRSGVLEPHGYPDWEGGVNKMYHGIKTFDPNANIVHLVMEPGDTVFFHPLIHHGSGTNSTKGFRKAISCHYASSLCNYIDVRGTVQNSIATEVLKVASDRMKKRYNSNEVKVDYNDIWRFVGKVVAGNRINL